MLLMISSSTTGWKPPKNHGLVEIYGQILEVWPPLYEYLIKNV